MKPVEALKTRKQEVNKEGSPDIPAESTSSGKGRRSRANGNKGRAVPHIRNEVEPGGFQQRSAARLYDLT